MTRHRSIARRIARRVALAAVLAVATTFAIGWVVPQSTGMSAITFAGPAPQGTFWLDETHGGSWIGGGSWSWGWIDLRRIIFVGAPQAQPFFRRDEPPAWARRISIDLREGFEEVVTVAAGWPWRAVAWERWVSWRDLDPTPVFSASPDGSVTITHSTPPREEMRHARPLDLGGRTWIIPTRVLWPGLLANLATAWAAWSLLLAGPFALRAVGRRLRRSCAHCGYSLQGTASTGACPECGAVRRRAASTAAARR